MTSFFVVKKGAAGTGGAGTSGVFGPTESYGEGGEWGLDGNQNSDGFYYAFGGSQTNQDYSFTPGVSTWTSITDQPSGYKRFQRTTGMATSFWGSFLQIFGGGTNDGYDSGAVTSTVRRYFKNTDSYTSQTSYPIAVSGLGLGPGYFVVQMCYGGKLSSSTTTFASYLYSAEDDSYTSKANMIAARSHQATFYYGAGGVEFAACGISTNDPQNTNWGYNGFVLDAWSTYTDVTTTFMLTTSSTPGSNASSPDSGGGQVCGGWGGAGANIWNRLYDGILTDTWSNGTGLPQSQYHMGGFGGRAGSSYLVGGKNSGGTDLDDVYKWSWFDDSFTSETDFAGGDGFAISGGPGGGK
jgi:hypothetical protein